MGSLKTCAATVSKTAGDGQRAKVRFKDKNSQSSYLSPFVVDRQASLKTLQSFLLPFSKIPKTNGLNTCFLNIGVPDCIGTLVVEALLKNVEVQDIQHNLSKRCRTPKGDRIGHVALTWQ